MMTETQKLAIIENGKSYFRQIIIPNHIKGLKKLKLKDFVVNPFLICNLESVSGDSSLSSESEVIRTVLDECIKLDKGVHFDYFMRSFGQNIGAEFHNQRIFSVFDQADGRKKYYQCLPNIQSVKREDLISVFKNYREFLETKGIDSVAPDDMIVGFPFAFDLRGTNVDIIKSMYPVVCGQEFWKHVAGDMELYSRLIKSI